MMIIITFTNVTMKQSFSAVLSLLARHQHGHLAYKSAAAILTTVLVGNLAVAVTPEKLVS